MSIPREDCEAKVLDKEIFVVGGYDGTNYFSDTESYNPITNIWRKCASMKQKRRAPGVCFEKYDFFINV